MPSRQIRPNNKTVQGNSKKAQSNLVEDALLHAMAAIAHPVFLQQENERTIKQFMDVWGVSRHTAATRLEIACEKGELERRSICENGTWKHVYRLPQKK